VPAPIALSLPPTVTPSDGQPRLVLVHHGLAVASVFLNLGLGVAHTLVVLNPDRQCVCGMLSPTLRTGPASTGDQLLVRISAIILVIHSSSGLPISTMLVADTTV